MTSIGKLFDELQAAINATAELNQRVDTGEYEQSISVDTGNKKLSLFDTPISVDAGLDAKVRICKAGEIPDSPFPGKALTLASGQQYTTLTIDGRLSAEGKATGTAGVLALSATASAKTGFAYAHFRPASGTQTRLKALLDLAASTEFPQSVDVTALTPGETLDLTTTLNIDLGLKAQYGATADIDEVIDILELVGGSGAALPFTAHIGFTASAAFGFSLYDSMRVTVGRAATTMPDWIRIRLERERRRRITFGVAVDLTIEYDATAGAQALLDKAFALIPEVEAIDTLKEIAALPADWNQFKTDITDRAAAIVAKLVDDTGWKNAVAASPAVAALIKTAQDVVRIYDGIDEKVQSIVEQVIARLDDAGLARLRPVIDQIAGFDPETFDVTSLLSNEASQVLHWLEVLTGVDIEELILTPNVKAQITRAVDAAKKLQNILNGAEDEVLKRVHELLDKSGATGLVEWLRKNATSVQQLQAAGDAAIEKLVRRLVGKALDQISDADVQKIQQFATRLGAILNAPDALKEKLEKGIAKLKGEVGFSFSLELSRVTEWSAVVDVELDRTSKKAVKATRSLVSGQFNQFLADLNQISTQPNDPRPYLIHEVLVSSRRIRTSIGATFLSIFNAKLTEQETATDEYTVSVREGDQGLVREGAYIGGAIARKQTGATTAEGGAWIRITATGDGPDITADYADAPVSVIRLSYSREDTKLEKEGRQSIADVLSELSFNDALKAVSPALIGQQTRFSLEIDLGGTAVQALKAAVDQASWNDDVLRAAHRWFLDVDRVNDLELRRGHEMAAVVVDPDFRKVWTDMMGNLPGDDLFEADARDDWGVRLIRTSPTKQFKIEYQPLATLMTLRASSFRKFTDFKASQASSRTPEILEDVALQASNLFRTGQAGWHPPLFNFWFVLARLLRLAPEVFASGRAVATLRTRQSANAEWSDPKVFALTAGISTGNFRLS